MGIPSDRRFLRAARRQLSHLFPLLPTQDALHKRRARLSETIEWLIGVFATQSPGSSDDLVLLDSTRVVRPLGRDNPPLRTRRCLWLRLLRKPLALVLGAAAASCLCPRWHSTRSDTGRRRPLRARGRTRVACPHAHGRRDDRLRQGLRRTGVRTVGQRTRRPDRQAGPQRRARQRCSSRADPAADRIGVRDLQGAA